MPLNNLQEIESAIAKLTPQELESFCEWFDQLEHPFDAQLRSDIAAGRLDGAIEQALADERNGKIFPL